MVFKPAFVILYTSDGQLSPPFQTSITVSGRTWGMGERQREKRRMEERKRKKGREKDVREGEDTERRGENKGFEYWYNNQK